MIWTQELISLCTEKWLGLAAMHIYTLILSDKKLTENEYDCW